MLNQVEKNAILQARAAKIAIEYQTEEQNSHLSANCLKIVAFLINDEKYAIETKYIQEVFPLKELAELPGIPNFVLGIVNVRGQIISVIDIRKFFGMPSKGLSDLNRIIILSAPKMEFGVLADSIIGVEEIKEEDLLPSLPTLTAVRAEYLKGVSRDHMIILDGDKLLGSSKLVVLDK